jgi:Ala-tRNA(Pro) deacylase
MLAARLRGFLDSQGINYDVRSHEPAYTALEVAAVTHVPGQEMAKPVMVKLEGEMAMAVVPASHRVDLYLLGKQTQAAFVELADETDFGDMFFGCDLGAMPPFGNLWGLPTYLAQALTEDQVIAFNAGSHTDVIVMGFDDYRRLVNPRILPFSCPIYSSPGRGMGRYVQLSNAPH